MRQLVHPQSSFCPVLLWRFPGLVVQYSRSRYRLVFSLSYLDSVSLLVGRLLMIRY